MTKIEIGNGLVKYDNGITWVNIRTNATVGDKINFKKWTRGKYRFKGEEVIEQEDNKTPQETSEVRIFMAFAKEWGEQEELNVINVLKNDRILDIFEGIVKDISDKLSGKRDDEKKD